MGVGKNFLLAKIVRRIVKGGNPFFYNYLNMILIHLKHYYAIYIDNAS